MDEAAGWAFRHAYQKEAHRVVKVWSKLNIITRTSIILKIILPVSKKI